jgi:hypothetical protein
MSSGISVLIPVQSMDPIFWEIDRNVRGSAGPLAGVVGPEEDIQFAVLLWLSCKQVELCYVLGISVRLFFG